MWYCFQECPCIRFRGETQTPLDQYYDDEDNLEFEHLLARQDSTSLSAFSTRTPFLRATNSPGYHGQNMIVPNEEATASANRLLLEDDENLQTQDAQYLPDEQISKFTELISEQSTRGKHNDEITDAQMIAEEEEARRQEEEEIERNRQAATQAALAKGLMSPEQAAANKNTFFTIEGDDEGDSNTAYSMNMDGSSVEFSTTTTANNKITSVNDSESQISSLNKPRNPHERFLNKDVNIDDYDDVNDFEDMPPTNSKDQITINDPLTSFSTDPIQEGA